MNLNQSLFVYRALASGIETSALPVRPEFAENVDADCASDVDGGMFQPVAHPSRRRIPRAGGDKMPCQHPADHRRRQDADTRMRPGDERRTDRMGDTPAEAGAVAAGERRIVMEESRHQILCRLADGGLWQLRRP